MTVSIKGLIAGLVTVAAIGTAFAQSSPPNPAAANPAIGAGQQSSQGTPMGMTGTPGGGGTTGATTAPRATMQSGSTATPAAPMASGSSDSTTMAATTRRTRADRN
jgi:hypothetical protein